MEQKKEPIKVRLTTVILVFIILLLILAICGMYFYYNMEINKKELNQNENIVETSNKTQETTNEVDKNLVSAEVKEIDINSNLVQELYKYVLKSNSCVEEIAYQNQKVTVDNLSNTAKLMTIFENIDDFEADDTKTNKTDYGISTHYYFEKETIENKAKKIFGKDVIINHETLPNLLAKEIVFTNGRYDKYDIQGGGGFLWEDSTQKLLKAEQNNNEIYIYDKYIHVVRDENNYNNYNIYNASDRKVLLKSNLSTTLIDIDTIEDVNTFKHTFKKNFDGTYYWYSTETIK